MPIELDGDHLDHCTRQSLKCQVVVHLAQELADQPIQPESEFKPCGQPADISMAYLTLSTVVTHQVTTCHPDVSNVHVLLLSWPLGLQITVRSAKSLREYTLRVGGIARLSSSK